MYAAKQPKISNNANLVTMSVEDDKVEAFPNIEDINIKL